MSNFHDLMKFKLVYRQKYKKWAKSQNKFLICISWINEAETQ